MFDEGFEDDYNDFGEDSFSYEDATNSPVGKRNIILIIVAVVCIAGLFFAISYFSTTIEYEFNIIQQGTLDPAINATLSIKDYATKEPIDIGGGKGSTQDVDLRPGKYSYTVIAPGFNPEKGIIIVSVSEDNKESKTITLQRNISAEIQVNLVDNGQEIYENEIKSGFLILSKTEGSAENISLTVSSENFEVILEKQKIDSLTTDKRIDFKYSIKKDISEIKEETITFSISGTNISESIKLVGKPALSLDEISLSGFSNNSFQKDSLKSGQKETINNIILKNNSKKVAINNMDIQIIPNIGFEDRMNWIQLIGGESTKTIEIIPASESSAITLIINIPVDAEIGDTFEGNIKFSSKSLQKDIERNIILRVSEESNISVELTGQREFSTSCNEGSCEEVDTVEKLKIKNTGEVGVENINLELFPDLSDGDCFVIMNLKLVDLAKLSVGEERPLVFDILPTDQVQNLYTECYLEITYDNPIITGQRTRKISNPIKITINK